MPNKLTYLEKTLSHLVSYRSISSDVTKNNEMLKWIARQLEESGMITHFHESNKHPSLVALSKEDTRPKLWLVGHVDIVPAPGEMFSMIVSEEKLIGRGVFDDKIAAASFITAVKQLSKGIQDYNFGIILTSDEEIGSSDGMGYLVNKIPIKGSVAFIPDSGQGWTIQTKAKGAIHLKVSAHGKSAHGSSPWEGENAIDLLQHFLTKMRKDLAIPSDGYASQNYSKTMNIGVIKGGKAVNQVPSDAEAMIDIRYTTLLELESIRTYINKVNKSDSEIFIKEMVYAAPVDVKEDDEWILRYKDILTKHRLTIQTSTSNGATDARFFSEMGVTTIVSMPNGGNLHAEGEWVDRQDANLLPHIVKDLIEYTRRL